VPASPPPASTCPELLPLLDEELPPLELPLDEELDPPELPLLLEEEVCDPELLELDTPPSGLAPASGAGFEPPLAQACPKASGKRKRLAQRLGIRAIVFDAGVRTVMMRWSADDSSPGRRGAAAAARGAGDA
jgi:hypothetical protein